MKRLILIVPLIFVACASAPPNLSPAARVAYGNTRVLKALDLVRDAAIDGNAKGVFSEAATRKVVTAHRSAIVVMNAAPDGWQSAVKAALDELLRDKTLLPSEVQLIAPYVPLVKSLIDQFAPPKASSLRLPLQEVA